MEMPENFPAKESAISGITHHNPLEVAAMQTLYESAFRKRQKAVYRGCGNETASRRYNIYR